MDRRVACGTLVLAVCRLVWVTAAPQTATEKSAAPLVTAVGCAQRSPQGVWTLANATEVVETRALFMSAKEVEEARKKTLGSGRYVLVGTADFLTKEELLKSSPRAEFTRPEVANATGQLQQGRKVIVKGLLVTAPNERRLNLVAVQQLADTCT
jgi:hypothetical protein